MMRSEIIITKLTNNKTLYNKTIIKRMEEELANNIRLGQLTMHSSIITENGGRRQEKKTKLWL